MPDDLVSVRYRVDDVQASVDYYTEYLGFELLSNAEIDGPSGNPIELSRPARS